MKSILALLIAVSLYLMTGLPAGSTEAKPSTADSAIQDHDNSKTQFVDVKRHKTMQCVDSLELKSGHWIRYYRDSAEFIAVLHVDSGAAALLWGRDASVPQYRLGWLFADFDNSIVWAIVAGGSGNSRTVAIFSKSRGNILASGYASQEEVNDSKHLLFTQFIDGEDDRLTLYNSVSETFTYFEHPIGHLAVVHTYNVHQVLGDEELVVEYYNSLIGHEVCDTLRAVK